MISATARSGSSISSRNTARCNEEACYPGRLYASTLLPSHTPQRAEDNHDAIADFQIRLELYRNRQPYRQ